VTDEDDELARRSARGDDAAFEALVGRLGPGLVRRARRLVGPNDADDVVQETLTRVYVALREGRYRPQGKLSGWAARIATRVALDVLRTRDRRRARERAVGSDPRTAPAAGGLTVDQVRRALETLPPKQRVALILKEIEGMTTREIAEAMDCSPGAVEQRLLRARRTLRARWSDD